MAEGPFEIEAKLRVRDRAALEKRLRALGASAGPTERETNDLLDDAAGALKARGEALRVRETAGRGLLTYKGKASVSRGVKTRRELETEIGSAATMRQVFRELGFLPRFAYEKNRTVWRFADPARPIVVIDETPIGLFAELEGSEGAVRGLASELGIAEEELLHESYVSLYAKAREADPSLPPDMRFARPEVSPAGETSKPGEAGP